MFLTLMKRAFHVPGFQIRVWAKKAKLFLFFLSSVLTVLQKCNYCSKSQVLSQIKLFQINPRKKLGTSLYFCKIFYPTQRAELYLKEYTRHTFVRKEVCILEFVHQVGGRTVDSIHVSISLYKGLFLLR